MGKVFSIYKGNIDKAWYNSSNIVYSECFDKPDSFKEVKVVFKNGNEYKYTDVKVQDYLMFREDASQGKALNKFIKQYPFVKMEEKRDLIALNEELEQYLEEYNKILQEQNNSNTNKG